jgi:hypothetical protein
MRPVLIWSNQRGESPSIVDLARESLSCSRFLYSLRGDGRQAEAPFIGGNPEEQEKLYRHSERHKLKKFNKIRKSYRFRSSSSGVWAGGDNDDFKQELHPDRSSGQSLSGREYADCAADGDAPWVSQQLSRTLRNEPENSPQL